MPLSRLRARRVPIWLRRRLRTDPGADHEHREHDREHEQRPRHAARVPQQRPAALKLKTLDVRVMLLDVPQTDA
jgi:hypothetical protein